MTVVKESRKYKHKPIIEKLERMRNKLHVTSKLLIGVPLFKDLIKKKWCARVCACARTAQARSRVSTEARRGRRVAWI